LNDEGIMKKKKNHNKLWATILWRRLSAEEKGRVCLAMFPISILDDLPQDKESRDEVIGYLMKLAGDIQ